VKEGDQANNPICVIELTPTSKADERTDRQASRDEACRLTAYLAPSYLRELKLKWCDSRWPLAAGHLGHHGMLRSESWQDVSVVISSVQAISTVLSGSFNIFGHVVKWRMQAEQTCTLEVLHRFQFFRCPARVGPRPDVEKRHGGLPPLRAMPLTATLRQKHSASQDVDCNNTRPEAILLLLPCWQFQTTLRRLGAWRARVASRRRLLQRGHTTLAKWLLQNGRATGFISFQAVLRPSCCWHGGSPLPTSTVIQLLDLSRASSCRRLFWRSRKGGLGSTTVGHT